MHYLYAFHFYLNILAMSLSYCVPMNTIVEYVRIDLIIFFINLICLQILVK